MNNINLTQEEFKIIHKLVSNGSFIAMEYRDKNNPIHNLYQKFRLLHQDQTEESVKVHECRRRNDIYD